MPRISVNSGFYLVFAISLLLIPLRFVLAWIAAVCVHEFGHYLFMRIFGVRVYELSIGATGVIMNTEPQSGFKRIICLLAGPVFGFGLIIFRKWVPILALCAFFQSVINLIPVYPLDGGQLLACALERLPKKYQNIVIMVAEATAGSAILFIGLYLTFVKLWGVMPLLTSLFLVLRRKLSCKQTP